MKPLLCVLVAVFLTGCLGAPANVKPVDNFVLEKYLGTWYEIARLDHSFERGLTHITAEYSLRDDGGVAVVNRGYEPEEQQWRSAEGRAYFVGEADKGYLKVSFFGPFYGSYVIFGLDKEGYQYAFVSGPDNSYLWFLSRTAEVEPELMAAFKQQAQSLGFDSTQLIMVDHQQPMPQP